MHLDDVADGGVGNRPLGTRDFLLCDARGQRGASTMQGNDLLHDRRLDQRVCVATERVVFRL